MAQTERPRIRPPFLWVALVATGWGLDALYPLPFVPGRYSPIAAGGIFILIGFAIVALAFHEMRDANSQSETEIPIPTLVTGGIFRLSRNPVYLGMHVALIGCAVALDSLWMLAMIIPFHAFLAVAVIPCEEAQLERTFDELYRDYKADVRRWL
jgi:protein-S-isoprenylcysteine O-methyltransferase Ste14